MSMNFIYKANWFHRIYVGNFLWGKEWYKNRTASAAKYNTPEKGVHWFSGTTQIHNVPE